MSFILNIDTSTASAIVCLAEKGLALHTISNANQKDHASFLHNAIGNIIKIASIQLRSLDAIAVVSGPGSYTGLRVGMASAKGLCYALNKPFITISALNMLADAAITSDPVSNESSLYCPMIDARRMEVFTALFDSKMNEVLSPSAMILDGHSFEERLKTNRICFFGDGSPKFEAVLSNKNAVFTQKLGIVSSLARLSFEAFLSKNFSHLVDSEPLYIKDFHISPDLHNKKQTPY